MSEQQQDPDKLKLLYDNLYESYELPDYETFKKDLSDEKKLRAFYDNVKKEYELPEYDVFVSDLGLTKKKWGWFNWLWKILNI